MGDRSAALGGSLLGVHPGQELPDLVWSGPEVPGLHARDTRRAYDELLCSAERSICVLHAKALVTDDEAVLVTSANLTEAALDRNIEIGLLVRDRALAASVSRHFQVLIDRELLRPLPAG